MNTLEELGVKSKEAFEAHEALNRKHQERKRELNAQMEATLNLEFGKQLTELSNARWAADKAYRAERERIDVERAQTNLKFPEGTVVKEWLPRYFDWNGKANRRWTGRVGIIHVKRSEDDRGARHNYDPVGAVMVQVLLANGKPGKTAVRFQPGVWLPKDQVHQECEQHPCPHCGKPRNVDGAKNEKFLPGSKCPECGVIEPFIKET